MDIKSAVKTLLEEKNCPGITKYTTIPTNLHIQVQNQVIHQEKKMTIVRLAVAMASQ